MFPGYDVPAGAPVLSRRKRSICRGRNNLSPAQKKDVLRIHNELRAREGASNMMNMVSVSLSSLNVNDLKRHGPIVAF